MYTPRDYLKMILNDLVAKRHPLSG